MEAAVALAALVGATLGLLGGGGSILMVPLFLGVLGVPPRQAIAWSLLVVSVTAAAAMIGHAVRGQVQWRRGLLFAAASMAGAFAGARLSLFVPEVALVLGFAAAMLVTGAAMIRGRRSDPRAGAGGGGEGEAAAGTAASSATVAFLALGVGLAAGMVGAGGGFLIVPALVLGARVPMRSAVGTSLLVLSLQSAAGFAGHASAVPLDWAVILPLAGASVAGGAVGSALSAKVSPAGLRTFFGWGVVAMAFYLVGHQLPVELRSSGVYRAVFVDRWPFWAGGAAIGALVLALLWSENKLLGVSTGCTEISELPWTRKLKDSWRVWLVPGIAIGGLWAGLLAGSPVTFASPWVDAVAGATWLRWPVLLGAGALIGYGTRQAGGCTSGHGIVGVAQLARSSLIATGTFMLAGFVTTQILARWRG